MKSAKKSSKKPSKKAVKPAPGKAAPKKRGIGAPNPPPGIPLVGQVALFGFGFAPAGWLPCDGRLMPIAQNQALFSLLGATYGGNGFTDFALPKLKPVYPSGPSYFIAVQGAFPNR